MIHLSPDPARVRAGETTITYQNESEEKTMANTTGKRADKRTAEQRRNDTAQKARPKGAQDTTFVTTGPATGKEDERAVGTEDK